jgi:16S rRNA (guanine1207-N2)-methyltransferase
VGVSEDHYFSAQPASADERREITVELAGRRWELETAPGVFSPGHLDLGTTVLLREVPPPPADSLLDLGCGWGPLALTAALVQPHAHVTAIDVNQRALDLLRRNAERIARKVDIAPIDALTPAEVAPGFQFRTVWSNPPIRIGKEPLHSLLSDWLPRIVPGGEAWLVVQKNLGADSLTHWLADQDWGTVERIASSKGFRVVRLVRNGESATAVGNS